MYEISYQLTRTDLAAYQQTATARLRAEANKATRLWQKIALWFGLVILFAIGLNLAHDTMTLDRGSILVGAGVSVLLVAALSWRTQSLLKSAIYSDNGPMLTPHHAVFDATGMRVQTAKMNAVYNWSIFTDITAGNDQFILWLEPALGFVIPHRAFKRPEDATAFAAFARTHIAAAAPTSPHTS